MPLSFTDLNPHALGHITEYLDDTLALSQTSSMLREYFVDNMLPIKRKQIKWEVCEIVNGANVRVFKKTLSKRDGLASTTQKELVFSHDQLRDCLRFFYLTPKVLKLKGTLSPHFLHSFPQRAIKDCMNSAKHDRRSLVLQLDKITLTDYEFVHFLQILAPKSLHLYGTFNRNFLDDDVLPENLDDLVVTRHPGRLCTTRITGSYVIRMIENWNDQTKSHPLGCLGDGDNVNYDLMPKNRLFLADCIVTDSDQIIRMLQAMIPLAECAKSVRIIDPGLSHETITRVLPDIDDLLDSDPNLWALRDRVAQLIPSATIDIINRRLETRPDQAIAETGEIAWDVNVYVLSSLQLVSARIRLNGPNSPNSLSLFNYEDQELYSMLPTRQLVGDDVADQD